MTDRRTLIRLLLLTTLAFAALHGGVASAQEGGVTHGDVVTPDGSLHSVDIAPAVSVEPSTPVLESLVGGVCYVGNVHTTQPLGFVLTRTGSTEGPLDVTIQRGGSISDVIRRGNDEIVSFGAGESSVFVPRLPQSEWSVSTASWSVHLSAGDGYAVASGTNEASFSGLAGASPESAGEPCPIEDGTQSLDLAVGEEHFPEWTMWRVWEFKLVDGLVPPGLRVDEEYGLAGTPTERGHWTVAVRKCPWPAVGERICGTTTYDFRVGSKAVGDAPTPMPTTPEAVVVSEGATGIGAAPTAARIAERRDDPTEARPGRDLPVEVAAGGAIAALGVALLAVAAMRRAGRRVA